MHHDYRKDARLPEQLQRAMAAEAEASREARAKVIAADGEKRASNALREASRTIDESPSALQLRYLQVRPILRHCIHTRRHVGSTDQAYPSYFYFRIT